MSRSDKQNTRLQSSSKKVRVTYFDSLYFGKEVQILRISRRSEPLLATVRLPDGDQIQMPLSHTDYSNQPVHDLEGKNLLDLEGLRKAVKIVEEIQRRGSSSPISTDGKG